MTLDGARLSFRPVKSVAHSLPVAPETKVVRGLVAALPDGVSDPAEYAARAEVVVRAIFASSRCSPENEERVRT